MNADISMTQSVLLSAIVLAALFVPFLFKKVEEELELFLFICGAAAVTVSGLWSGHLITEALKEPLLISIAVLVLGFLFKRFGGRLHFWLHRAEEKTGPKWFLFLLVLILAITSSLITAIIAALIGAEVIKGLRLSEKQMVRLTVYLCFAIGLGAVLTPVGEPLSTIVVARLRAEPYQAGFFFLLQLLGLWILPGLFFFAALASTLGQTPLTDGTRATSADTNAEVLGRAGKVYLFVAALILLGEGLKPLAQRTIGQLSRAALYWINTLSAVLDNATLASIEIQPTLPQDTLVFLLVSLVVAGGLLIPGNIPNIICASKLEIKSRLWARTALPIGLGLMAAYFATLLLFL